MKLGLGWTRSAGRDLDDLLDYYRVVSRDTAANVLADINATLLQLRVHPESAPVAKTTGLRKAVTSRYQFVPVYRASRSRIVVAGLHRQQDRPY